MKLLIATRNLHKLEEIKAIFNMASIDLVSMDDFKNLPDVIEDGATFESNAIKKAVMLALTTKLWTLADDSGLQVDCLNGEPGIRSARYAGEPVDYTANNTKLLKNMKGISNRFAHFCCAVALSSPSGRSQVVMGKCDGRIIDDVKGSNGFGYDPLFVPNGYDQTFAEMDNSLKNRISHRAIALGLAVESWGDMLKDGAVDWTIQSRRSGRPPRNQ
ncbi:MAG: RdgB/HAM1 family non-canonical purine NTP pyrophosphatase [Kiritimatiellae bacterium]|nr:RdgB/HAM1 family non-canonical purine NTP pyrophosphatase [Kiritimatiellia bacterium]MDD5521341.1 RdgB/HAM1 family non-canonical purine NTP pyrophosphatase [Kiritimatiellia bacterium]